MPVASQLPLLPYGEVVRNMKKTDSDTHSSQLSLEVTVDDDSSTHLREFLSKNYKDLLGASFYDSFSRKKLGEVIENYLLDRQHLVPTGHDPTQYAKEMTKEIAGLGPLDDIITCVNVSNIMVNGPKEIKIETPAGEEMTDIKFDSEEHLQLIVKKILNLAGAPSATIANPIVEAMLDDIRITVTIPPVSDGETYMTIRKHSSFELTREIALDSGMITEDGLELCQLLIEGGANVFVVGPTNSGKTHFVKFLAGYICDERIITAEDVRELRLKKRYPDKEVLSLLTRLTEDPSTNIGMARLLKVLMRHNPGRILVGEVRAEEAADLIEIFNTGHQGGIGTFHAFNAQKAVKRMLQMALRAGQNINADMLSKDIADCMDVVIAQRKLKDGSRKIIEIAEVLGYENGQPQVQRLFRFKSMAENGKKNFTHERDPDGYLSSDLAERMVLKGIDKNRLKKWVRPEVFESL